jgi:hypothetical protein
MQPTAEVQQGFQVPVPKQDLAKGVEAVKEAEDRGVDTMDAGIGGETIKVPYLPQMKIRGFDRADRAAVGSLALPHTDARPQRWLFRPASTLEPVPELNLAFEDDRLLQATISNRLGSRS